MSALDVKLIELYTQGMNAPVPSQIGYLATVDATGRNLAYLPVSEALAGSADASSAGSVASGGGTQVTDLPISNGYSYEVTVTARASNGAGGIEYLGTKVAHVYAIAGTVTIVTSADGLGNFAAGWALGIAAVSGALRATVTNTSGNARNVRTLCEITLKDALP